MKYRNEIDGLRAIAVLPVMFFHAGSSWFSGGFVGVDVFFVISGYLITSILFSEKAAGKFSLTRFYERRARRILPAMFVVILFCLPFAWLWMLPHQLKEFSQSLVGVSVFSSNILFWKQSGYFDASAELKPLLHTWSLAVEEQYYLLFPIILIALWRFNKRWLNLLVFVGGILSLGWATWLVQKDASGAFYLLPTRAWELLIGAAIAMYVRSDGNKEVSYTLRQVASVVGLAMIVFSIFFYDRQTPFPSLYALVPTLGAAMIIKFADDKTSVGRLLAFRGLTAVGLVSYSLYLWHQPILAFFKIKTGLMELSGWMVFLYVLLTFSMAYLSYLVVEKPFRSKEFISRQGVFSLAIVGLTFFSALGYAGHSTQGFYEAKINSIPQDKRALLVSVEREVKLRTAVADAQHDYLSNPKFDQSRNSRRIVIVGDSLAADFAIALAANRNYFQHFDIRLLDMRTECIDSLMLGSHLSITASDGSDAQTDCKFVLQKILSSDLLSKSDLIVVSALWKADTDFDAVERLLVKLKEQNSNMLALGSSAFLDIPSLAFKIATDSKHYSQDEIDELIAKSRRDKFENGNRKVAALMERLGIYFFDRNELYCNNTNSRCRILMVGGDSLIWDNAHLSVLGMRTTAERVADLGWLEKK